MSRTRSISPAPSPRSSRRFCSFGDQKGTVEGIGIRSTKLRALDRTLISVPNAQFAEMQIITWAECDQMLIKETIGVRYETEPDRLRYLLARLRELDAERGDAAKATVDRWRKAGKLPFPRLPHEAIERLEGTLDYPPTGSPETAGEDPQDAIGAERLSRASHGPEAEEDAVAGLPVDQQKKS